MNSVYCIIILTNKKLSIMKQIFLQLQQLNDERKLLMNQSKGKEGMEAEDIYLEVYHVISKIIEIERENNLGIINITLTK